MAKDVIPWVLLYREESGEGLVVERTKKMRDEIISKLFRFREMHSYSDNDADATLTSDDDEHVKFEAHKGINMDTLGYAVEPSVIIDINLASMDEFAELKAHKVISRLAALS